MKKIILFSYLLCCFNLFAYYYDSTGIQSSLEQKPDETSHISGLSEESQKAIEAARKKESDITDLGNELDNLDEIKNAYAQIFNKVKELADELGYASNMKDYKNNPENYKGNVADIATVLRVALTTKSNTPDLFEIMKLFTKDRVQKRYNDLINKFNQE